MGWKRKIVTPSGGEMNISWAGGRGERERDNKINNKGQILSLKKMSHRYFMQFHSGKRVNLNVS